MIWSGDGKMISLFLPVVLVHLHYLNHRMY